MLKNRCWYIAKI